MINIFVGCSQRFEEPCLQAFTNAVKANTNSYIQFISASPESLGVPETGCTGFSNCRYMIPEFMGYKGYAIYLDCDMLVLGDIAELYEYRQPGKWVCMQDGQTEVSIIDCSAFTDLPKKEFIATRNKNEYQHFRIKDRMARTIPPEWNVYDCHLPADWEPDENTKLLHFTDLKHQPWTHDDHHCLGAVKLWADYGGQVLDSYRERF